MLHRVTLAMHTAGPLAATFPVLGTYYLEVMESIFDL